MATSFDLVIIGAGPAGLAALQTARHHGLNSAIVDENSNLGGRIYKGIRQARADGKRLDETYGADGEWASSMIAKVQADDYGVFTGHTVINVTRTVDNIWNVHLLAKSEVKEVRTRQVLIATGAKERPYVFPGWTLPGVMTAGAIQTLMKDSNCLPEGPLVLAGSGPLLLLLANQLLEAGVPIAALLDTMPPMNFLRAAPHILGACGVGSALWKGLALSRCLRGKFPYFRSVSEVEAHGTERVSSVSFRSLGRLKRMDTSFLVTHTGIVPDTQLSRLMGCSHHWSQLLHTWVPDVDETGQSSLPGISIVGDATGSNGALDARSAGHLSALSLARELNIVTDAEYSALAKPVCANRRRIEKERRFLNHLFAPRPLDWRTVPDNTILCRCEEVDFGTLREMIVAGISDFNHFKSVTRCGMGLCQGRICADLAASALAEGTGALPSGPHQMKIRAPLKPMPFRAMTHSVNLAKPSPTDDFVYTSEEL